MTRCLPFSVVIWGHFVVMPSVMKGALVCLCATACSVWCELSITTDTQDFTAGDIMDSWFCNHGKCCLV